MNVTVKKIAKSKVELSVGVGKDEVARKYEDVYKQINEEAKIPGFRPGKIPRDMLEKRFHDTARSLVSQYLVEELYEQAVKQENIFVIDHPQISEVNLKADSFSFKATVEVKPEAKIKKYKAIKIKREPVEITDDKVKEALENIKKEKKAEAIDDSLAKSLGYPSLANLQEIVKNQLFLAVSENARNKHEAQVVDFLIGNSEIELPASVIERELKERLHVLEYRLMQQGAPKEKIEEKKKEVEASLREAAAKDLKIYFILDKIAELENIKLDEKHNTAKVMEFLLKEAEWAE